MKVSEVNTTDVYRGGFNSGPIRVVQLGPRFGGTYWTYSKPDSRDPRDLVPIAERFQRCGSARLFDRTVGHLAVRALGTSSEDVQRLADLHAPDWPSTPEGMVSMANAFRASLPRSLDLTVLNTIQVRQTWADYLADQVRARTAADLARKQAALRQSAGDDAWLLLRSELVGTGLDLSSLRISRQGDQVLMNTIDLVQLIRALVGPASGPNELSSRSAHDHV